MTDEPESTPNWDETVDVLCVGDGPGSLAYGILCAASDLEVLIVESARLDSETEQWRAEMTEDLHGNVEDPHLALIYAEPVVMQKTTDRTRLEPFVGEHLRRWSAGCLNSPFGVMTSHVPGLDTMRTRDGQTIVAGVLGPWRCDVPPGPALAAWLTERAEGLLAPADDRLDGLVLEDGRIAGVVLDTADGPRRIGATHGLALGLGSTPDTWPEQPELAGQTVDVALIGRRAGRFARVGLLAR